MIEIRRILCPCDLSGYSARALTQARRIAERYGSSLTVLHVIPTKDSRPDLAAELQERAREWLRGAVPEEVRSQCAVEEIVGVGKAHREIARIARDRGAELIVLGAQGADALDVMIFGSTAQRVLRMAPCPVLTARAG